MSEDKINLLKAYGAEVVVSPTAVPPDSPDSYNGVADRLAREIQGAFSPTSSPTPSTRGPLPDDRPGDLAGHRRPGRRLRGWHRHRRHHQRRRAATSRSRTPTSGDRRRPGGFDPLRRFARPYLVEGIGEDFWPPTFDPVGRRPIIAVTDAESFAMTRRLAREEGLLVGGSCGMAAYAALQVAAELRRRGARRGDRRAPARLGPRLPDEGLQRRVAGAVRLRRRARHAATSRPSARCCAASPGGCPTSCTPTRARRSPRRSRSSRSTASHRCRWCAPSRRSWRPRSRARSRSAPCSTRSSPAHAHLTDPVEDHMSCAAAHHRFERVGPRRGRAPREGRRGAGARGRQAGRRPHRPRPAGLPRRLARQSDPGSPTPRTQTFVQVSGATPVAWPVRTGQVRLPRDLS